DRVDAAREELASERAEAVRRGARAEAGVDEDARGAGFNQRGVPGRTAAEDVDAHPSRITLHANGFRRLVLSFAHGRRLPAVRNTDRGGIALLRTVWVRRRWERAEDPGARARARRRRLVGDADGVSAAAVGDAPGRRAAGAPGDWIVSE